MLPFSVVSEILGKTVLNSQVNINRRSLSAKISFIVVLVLVGSSMSLTVYHNKTALTKRLYQTLDNTKHVMRQFNRRGSEGVVRS